MQKNIIPFALLTFFALCCTCMGNSQIITNAEYFINTDPGVGKGLAIPVAPGNTVNTDFTIHANSLQPGFNQVFIRIQDQNNNWSITEKRTVYLDTTFHAILPVIAGAEYFFDTDPGAGNGIPLSVANSYPVNALFNIPSSLVTKGFHQFFIRLKDEYNNWSITEQRSFYIDNNLYHSLIPLVAAAYFINADNGVGTGTTITVIRADSVNGSFSFIPSNLPYGKYIMSVRTQDSSGNWSIGESHPFTLCTISGATSDFTFTLSNNSVNFRNTSLNATSYHWNFGDGDTSNAINPTHIYKPGLYNACLISKNICDSAGNTSCKTVRVDAVLPLILAGFHLKCLPNQVILTWQTVFETNSLDFEIQQSSNGFNSWTTIGLLPATGNSNTVKDYQFKNDKAGGRSFYRLRLTDNDGKSAYSEILGTDCGISEGQINVYPVPAINEINISIKSDNDDEVTISLLDVYGRTIKRLNRNITKGPNILRLNTAEIASGQYFLKIRRKEQLYTQKVIVNH